MNTPQAIPPLCTRAVFAFVLLVLAACTTPKRDKPVIRLTPYPVSPASAESAYANGIMAQGRGDLAVALNAFTFALDLNPGYLDARFHRGQVHFARKEFAEAVTDFTAVIDQNPGDAMAYFARGSALREARDYTAALADYDRGIALKPKLAGAYVDRGIVYNYLNREADAAADFDRAIACDPDHASGYYHRSIIRRRHDDLPGALEDLNRTIALDPLHFIEAYGARAEVRLQLKDYPPALTDIAHVLAIDPQNPFAYGTRGMIRAAQHDWAGAIADYDRALALAPHLMLMRMERGKARIARKDFSRAISDYTEILAVSTPENDRNYTRRREFAHGTLGMLHWIQGEYPAALADYEASVVPHSPEPRFQYFRFCRHLLIRRLHRPDSDNLALIVPQWKAGWPKTIGLYLTGALSEEKFLAAANDAPDEKTRKGRLCEAYFYAGMIALLDGHSDAASEKFTACLATGVTDFTEYSLAEAELSSLPAPSASPAPRA